MEEVHHQIKNGSHTAVISLLDDVDDDDLDHVILRQEIRPLSPQRSQICRQKTCFAVLSFFVAAVLNDAALAWIHERVPPRTVEPLPDLWFFFFPEVIWAINIAEALIFVTGALALTVLLLHQHRWITVRRVLFIATLCYFFRALCISLLQVPVPSKHTYCAPKAEHSSIGLVFTRIFATLSSLGMDLYKPRDLCGDLIISGHTISLILAYLSVKQYSPKRIGPYLSFITGTLALVGMISILLARRHYSIDVLLAYFLTTRTFWIYHALVSEPDSSLKEVWWHPIFRYLESDAPASSLWHNRLQFPSSCFNGRS